ncbi:hypothetical protein NOR51B_2779 [Luminiphilus syltensis NOR5-1B]|uniref:Uncharacterized protein n=1 Tax=Luminiphilus syltensis NOR5-1B TaxID=565045 RepID=B8KSJ8_9GAMM|nr:hypothetical protein NOR51B_2779 [Luminiphilus syltensis NOR5-1B]
MMRRGPQVELQTVGLTLRWVTEADASSMLAIVSPDNRPSLRLLERLGNAVRENAAHA